MGVVGAHGPKIGTKKRGEPVKGSPQCAGSSADQVACVHPHKPQLAEIGFSQQFQNGVDVILSGHFLRPSYTFSASCLRYYLNGFLSLLQGVYWKKCHNLFVNIFPKCAYCTKTTEEPKCVRAENI